MREAKALRAMIDGRTHWRRPAVLVTVLLMAGALPLYGRQIVSYTTHLKGSPPRSWPLEPFPPAAQPDLHFAAAGDVGEAGGRVQATGRTIAAVGRADPYDALILLGDNVYPDGDPARLQEKVFEPFAGVLGSGARLWAVLGNHDVKEGHAEGQVQALGMPGRWYALELGSVLFVGLDSNLVADGGQRAWLERTLAASTARWKIAAVHHPPYSAGYQGSNQSVRRAFSPIFERYGVALVLSGHDHDYQRSERIGGVTYIVTGAAANSRRTGSRDFTAFSAAWHHFVDVNVFWDRLVVRAVNQDDRVFDEISIPART